MRCDSCQMATIQGIPCHETGCPVDAEMRRNACGECGEQMETDGRNTRYCPSCDTCYACGMFDGHEIGCVEVDRSA